MARPDRRRTFFRERVLAGGWSVRSVVDGSSRRRLDAEGAAMGNGERSGLSDRDDWRGRITTAVGVAVCMAGALLFGPMVGINGFWPGMLAGAIILGDRPRAVRGWIAVPTVFRFPHRHHDQAGPAGHRVRNVGCRTAGRSTRSCRFLPVFRGHTAGSTSAGCAKS